MIINMLVCCGILLTLSMLLAAFVIWSFANSLDPGQYQQISYIHHFYQTLDQILIWVLSKENNQAGCQNGCRLLVDTSVIYHQFFFQISYMHYFYQSGTH